MYRFRILQNALTDLREEKASKSQNLASTVLTLRNKKIKQKNT